MKNLKSFKVALRLCHQYVLIDTSSVEKTVQMLFIGARESKKGIDGNQKFEKPVKVRL